MSDRERERAVAIIALLALPDPPELRRSHHTKCVGNPFTRERRRVEAAQRSTLVRLALRDPEPKLKPARPVMSVVRRRA